MTQDKLALGTGQVSPNAMSGLSQRIGRAAQTPGLVTWGVSLAVRPGQGSPSARCSHVGARA